jgi:hypothetical protein
MLRSSTNALRAHLEAEVVHKGAEALHRDAAAMHERAARLLDAHDDPNVSEPAAMEIASEVIEASRRDPSAT